MLPCGRARQASLGQLLEARGHVGDRLVVDILPASQCSAASTKIVRPTAKPLTMRRLGGRGEGRFQLVLRRFQAEQHDAAAPADRASAITASIFAQAPADACGSSFHQSGLMPSA